MSAKNTSQPSRRARQQQVILSAYRIVGAAEPTPSDYEKWLSFFDAGGTPGDFLARLRNSDGLIAGGDARGAFRHGRLEGAMLDRSDPDESTNGSEAVASPTVRGSVVILSTYPADPPTHGGQHRIRQIGLAYAAAGFTVRHAGVLGSAGYPQSSGFLPFPGNAPLTAVHPNLVFMEDWAIGQLFASGGKHEQALAAHLGPAPDVIHVEQPWLFRFATRWAARASKRPLIIYGSQNVEHLLKFSIVESYFGRKAALDARQKVLDCELEAIRSADVVVAVSAEDCRWIAGQGGPAPLLAANGVHQRQATDAGIVAANAISGNARFALVSGSAHPPNISSLYEIFGDGMACFSPRDKLVIAGGLGPAMQSDSRYRSNAGLQRYLQAPGIVDEECLAGLLRTAHAVILPITSGEGSNLKTAEALWAGKHIVATKLAFRGYETFVDAPGVVIADDSASFLHALREVMSSAPFAITPEERLRRRQLLWSRTLRPLIERVRSLQRNPVTP